MTLVQACQYRGAILLAWQEAAALFGTGKNPKRCQAAAKFFNDHRNKLLELNQILENIPEEEVSSVVNSPVIPWDNWHEVS